MYPLLEVVWELAEWFIVYYHVLVCLIQVLSSE